jgi:hypothetical protein
MRDPVIIIVGGGLAKVSAVVSATGGGPVTSTNEPQAIAPQ